MPDLALREQGAPLEVFTLDSFDAARRAGATALTHEVDELRALNAYLKGEVGRSLPGDPARLTFGIWRPYSKTPHFHELNPEDLLVPADQLATPQSDAHTTLTKREVEAGGPIYELQTTEFRGSLSGRLARRILWESPEESKIIASPMAWVRAAQHALRPSLSNNSINRLVAEAERRFPGALFLHGAGVARP